LSECGGGQPSNDARTARTLDTRAAERGDCRDRSTGGYTDPPLLELRGRVLTMETRMMLRRSWVFAILLVGAACRDVAAPPMQPDLTAVSLPSPAGIHMLRQAPGAPALERYEVSFWACAGEASSVTVRYLPVDGESVGQPFLHFEIGKNALAVDPSGRRMNRGDSVLITLIIDPVDFTVDFRPSGMRFSNGLPARLTFWYENADPDLNADGVVDGTDEVLAQQIGVWGNAGSQRWTRLPSTLDPSLPSVSTFVKHFSEYAASW